jgi:hypothetical protein
LLSTSVSEYRDRKTDRKSLNIEGEWGQGGDRLLSPSVSEYRDIREIEKGRRVGLSPSVSEYIDIKTDRKNLNIEGEVGGKVEMDCCLPLYLNTEI